MTSKRKTYLFLNKCLVLNVHMDSQPVSFHINSRNATSLFLSVENIQRSVFCVFIHIVELFSQMLLNDISHKVLKLFLANYGSDSGACVFIENSLL